jgi:hypothetical protein
MLKYSKLSPVSRKFLAWKWCLVEDKDKQLNKDKCDKLYEEYMKLLQKKNKEQ